MSRQIMGHDEIERNPYFLELKTLDEPTPGVITLNQPCGPLPLGDYHTY
jgi:hypothetical protein